MSDSYSVPYLHRDPRPEDNVPRGVEDARAGPRSGVEDARSKGRRIGSDDARAGPSSGVEDARPKGRRVGNEGARADPSFGVEDARPNGRKGHRVGSDGAPAGSSSRMEDARHKSHRVGADDARSFRVEDARSNGGNQGVEFKLVVAAIDFGTTYSGFAYGFRDELAKDFSRVHLTSWSSTRGGPQALISQKTPTSLLLNPEGEFAAFGFEAEEQYMDLANDSAHMGWKFFRRFKMKLHNNEGLRRDTTLLDDQGNSMQAIDIFAHSIRYLKQRVEEALDRTGYTIHKEEIKWVLTIPAIWDPRSKQFMREAAEMAGIPPHQLEFALEPEAASVFLKEVLVEVHHEDAASEAALTAFPPGTKYLVLDLGGGTIDITARTVMEDKTLKELHYATGNGHGGNTINDKFMEYVREIFGQDVMDEFQNDLQYKSDVLDLEQEIEMKKRTIESQVDSRKFLTLKLPASLLEIFQEKNQSEISSDARIKTMKDKIEVKGDKLRLHMDVISKFFTSALHNIVEDTKKVLQKEDCRDIDRIMLVGGFAESKIVSKAISNAFDKVKVITPTDPGLAVLKGAVIYRHWPEVVSLRKCPHTYGSRLMRYFLEGFDDKKKLKTIRGQPMCTDVFSKFVTVGEDFQTDQSLEALEVFPVRADDTDMTVWIFKTDAEDAKYVTDPGCTKLGIIKVKMPDTSGGLDRKVDLTMTLGHTEIVVKGKHWPDGEEATVTFDMLS